MITYGPCPDGYSRVANDNVVIATPYDDELAAKAAAEQMAAGRGVKRTVFPLYGARPKPFIRVTGTGTLAAGAEAIADELEAFKSPPDDAPGLEARPLVTVAELFIGEPIDAEPVVDDEILDQSIAKLSADLATGDYDGQLGALGAAERGGKTRKGALAAIAERRKDFLALRIAAFAGTLGIVTDGTIEEIETKLEERLAERLAEGPVILDADGRQEIADLLRVHPNEGDAKVFEIYAMPFNSADVEGKRLRIGIMMPAEYGGSTVQVAAVSLVPEDG